MIDRNEFSIFVKPPREQNIALRVAIRGQIIEAFVTIQVKHCNALERRTLDLDKDKSARFCLGAAHKDDASIRG